MGKYLAVLVLCFGLVACSGTESRKVSVLKKTDKQLSCKEVRLEINEAEFYRQKANENKAPGLSTVVSPIGYISTYMDANDAVKSADERIDYLNRIYDINQCDNERQAVAAYQPQPMPQASLQAMQQPVMAPAQQNQMAYNAQPVAMPMPPYGTGQVLPANYYYTY